MSPPKVSHPGFPENHSHLFSKGCAVLDCCGSAWVGRRIPALSGQVQLGMARLLMVTGRDGHWPGYWWSSPTRVEQDVKQGSQAIEDMVAKSSLVRLCKQLLLKFVEGWLRNSWSSPSGGWRIRRFEHGTTLVVNSKSVSTTCANFPTITTTTPGEIESESVQEMCKIWCQGQGSLNNAPPNEILGGFIISKALVMIWASATVRISGFHRTMWRKGVPEGQSARVKVPKC